jgi:hypothetical protein
MILVVTDKMANEGGICPVCAKFFIPNGVGPVSLPQLTTVLNNLPSSHILRHGARYHDWYYHFAGNWGERKDADLIMYRLNEAEIKKKCEWYNAWFYNAMNYRNYIFCRIFGEKIWNLKDCM